MVDLLIKEIHTSDELISKAIQFNCWNHPKIQDFYLQLCWRECRRNNAQWRAIARAHSALRWSLARPNGEHQ